MSDQRQMSDSYGLGLLLALAGGFLDAYTYLLRGGVFANAQTGNIVLLGIQLAQGQWARAGHYLVPVVTFAVGVLLTEGIRGRFSQGAVLHWRQIVLGAEIMVLAAVAWIPLGRMDMLVNVLISFVCALQVQSFRKVDGNSMATTMCTGNLRSGTELLCRFWQTKDIELLRRAGEYYGIILAFVVGAATGGVACLTGNGSIVLIPVICLLAAFMLMFLKGDNNKKDPFQDKCC